MRTAAILVIIALSGCAVNATQSAEDARASIDRNNANAIRWYAAGDADSLASMFAGDAWQMPRLEADGQWRVVSDAPVSEMPR